MTEPEGPDVTSIINQRIFLNSYEEQKQTYKRARTGAIVSARNLLRYMGLTDKEWADSTAALI